MKQRIPAVDGDAACRDASRILMFDGEWVPRPRTGYAVFDRR
ncbi:hypothetical protein [Burkholderia seminalis]|nr:hypothetical protein [Burkholderia seminalis]